MVKWNREFYLLTIEQSSSPLWTYIVIGVIGSLIFPVGLIGMIVQISEQMSANAPVMRFFNSGMLVFHFMTAIGYGMVYAGFSSQSYRRNQEKIIFNNDRMTVELYMNSLGEIPYEIPYGDISHIHTLKETGGPDYPDVSHIYLIKKDGAEYWITGFDSASKKPERFTDLVNDIASHTGSAVKDSSNMGTEKEAQKSYERGNTNVEYSKSGFLKQSMSAEGDIFILKPSVKTLSFYLIGIIVYLFFFAVPLYIINNIFTNEIPIIVKGLAVLSIIMWCAVLIVMLIISMKDFKLIVNDTGIKAELQFKPLTFLNSKVSIPAGHIHYVRTNRLAGGHFLLSLGLSPDEIAINKGLKFLMNLSAYKKINAISKFNKGANEISLWQLPSGTRRGKGPTIFDLSYIEKSIQDRIRLIEKDINA